ncbi:MAG: protein-L-isoaspartate(D-aspartate) O-methyltransferase [Sphingobacteriales bacterium]|jgi:protein-L-isoaspartate(D-aspartate) O-methyltransferase|nr:protein-L-isoaspartate(D-aspartate) O-methyltransferase [Sphingobacteriales bacterium]MBP9141406.1 protein-L-isoaspartate(D-aspartate) O-methyltransferase [Chitinophagales bacterium]MDA0197550.1 protein-L-isoaspartate(D-aspartate) O-methyltransferase [Bacteroidota bacterium]MBK6890564.1 protein-L-isoaspartate(D-aspartate) O-methyltransferase [Sphingobacteriales bacterium]MBK7526385.1 protein-L-isoaspartate(D-aspartate) O-methyltransferase [Sphingobacteriales bacterium]
MDNSLIDNFKHKGLRDRLMYELVDEGIKDTAVLFAIHKVPRHYFFPPEFAEQAYQNKAFPIGQGQTISQPFTVAYQSSMLQTFNGANVLEIGTGSGYQCAILLEMGCRVVSIERDYTLHVAAKKLLKQMGYHPTLLFGDGYEGAAQYAPFDRILITAAAPEIPITLLNQLKIGGMMVVPVGKNIQTMVGVTRKSENGFVETKGDEFKFVPMTPGVVK